jgi:polyferredoxin
MQTRRHSAIEAIASTAIGFAVSLALTFTILPIFGYNVTTPHAWGITAIYTAASIIRSYLVRRAFNGQENRAKRA